MWQPEFAPTQKAKTPPEPQRHGKSSTGRVPELKAIAKWLIHGDDTDLKVFEDMQPGVFQSHSPCPAPAGKSGHRIVSIAEHVQRPLHADPARCRAVSHGYLDGADQLHFRKSLEGIPFWKPGQS